MADGRVVFLCWSGTRSGKVAEALEAALLKLGCGLEPFRSPEIAKGSLWFDQVREKLDAAQTAIVCLTPENAVGAWIHFEAGAIAAKMAAKSRAQVGPRENKGENKGDRPHFSLPFLFGRRSKCGRSGALHRWDLVGHGIMSVVCSMHSPFRTRLHA